MLDAFLSHLPSIWTAISGLIGGGLIAGLVEAYQTYHTQRRKDDAQDHDQDIELSEHLEQRLSKVEGRLDAAEEELRTTKKELTQSRLREEELQAAIDALVQRIDKLIDRLEEHEQISEAERDRLTTPPYVDHNSTDATSS